MSIRQPIRILLVEDHPIYRLGIRLSVNHSDMRCVIVAEADSVQAAQGAGTYNYGATVTLSATPAANYNFINWTKGNEVVATTPSFTFTVAEAGDYIANFEEIIIPTYTVTVSADPETFGTVTGGGTYEEGETVTITATPAAECMFLNWTENGTVVSEALTFTFTVTSDRTFVAHFDVDGITEVSGAQFNIYPNPVVNELMINSESVVTRCEIFTINGKLVYSQDYNTNSVNVNVENLSAGSYIVRVVSEGMVQTKRFIKK